MAKNTNKSNTYVVEKAANVILRGRVNKSGTVTLYLDWHGSAGREYEFLEDKIYHKPQNSSQKEYNQEVLRNASEILSLKNIELLKNSSLSTKVYGNLKLSAFYSVAKEHSKKRGGKKEPNTKLQYDMAMNKIKEFIGHDAFENLTLKKITKEFVWNYREWLLSQKLEQSTMEVYFANFQSVINLAVKKDYLDKSPFKDVFSITRDTPNVNYIFHQDIIKLKDAYCDDGLLKKFCLFSSQTGMRIGDGKQLKWNNIFYDEENKKYRIPITQEKTDKPYIIYFRQDVMDIIGPPGNTEEFVFPFLNNNTNAAADIAAWFHRAGVMPRGIPDQRFTPHDFRHSFAINMGLFGANIYEISQMLGHKFLATTEKYYARILEELKRKVIDQMPQL
jgi:integrase/recombinase XerD